MSEVRCPAAVAVPTGRRIETASVRSCFVFRLEVAGTGQFVAHCRWARSVWESFRGLMLAPPLRPGEALWLPACGAVHTAFLRGPVDLLFLEGDTIVDVRSGVRPWSAAACRGARSVVELADGEIERLGLVPGQRLLGLPVRSEAPVDRPPAARRRRRRRG